MKDYKAKAEFYVRQHQDHAAIAKLRSNIPLTADDVSELEEILWSEVGSRQDYEAEFGKSRSENLCGRLWAWIRMQQSKLLHNIWIK